MSSNTPEKSHPADRRAAKMRSRVVTTAATYCVLSLAGAVSFVIPDAVPVGGTVEIPRPVYGPQPSVALPDTIAGAVVRGEDAAPTAAPPGAPPDTRPDDTRR